MVSRFFAPSRVSITTSLLACLSACEPADEQYLANQYGLADTQPTDSVPPAILWGPFIELSGSSLDATWATSEPAWSVLEYGTTAALDQTVTSAWLGTNHSLTLTGLAPDSMYWIRVCSTDVAGNQACSELRTVFTGTAFFPSRIPGLKMWVSSSDLAALGMSVGQKVDRWPDRSGNSNHAFQSVFTTSAFDARPTFDTVAIAGTAPGVVFDGTTYLDIRREPGPYDNAPGFSTSDTTIFFVGTQAPIRPNTGGDHYALLGDHNATHVSLARGASSCLVRDSSLTYAELGACHDDYSLDSTPHLFAMRRSGTRVDFFQKDGTLRSSHEYGSIAPFLLRYLGSHGSGRLYSDGSVRYADDSYTGAMGEVLVYGSALSNEDVTRVAQYLVKLHGLADVVPPRFVWGPVIQSSGDYVTVSWGTNEPASSVVEYGRTSALGLAASSLGFGRDHSILLTGLLRNTTYWLRACSTDVAGNKACSDLRTVYTGTFFFPAPMPSLKLLNLY